MADDKESTMMSDSGQSYNNLPEVRVTLGGVTLDDTDVSDYKHVEEDTGGGGAGPRLRSVGMDNPAYHDDSAEATATHLRANDNNSTCSEQDVVLNHGGDDDHHSAHHQEEEEQQGAGKSVSNGAGATERLTTSQGQNGTSSLADKAGLIAQTDQNPDIHRVNSVFEMNGGVISPVSAQVSIDDTLEEREDDEEVSLVYARHEKIPRKDFAAEVRASVDVENYLAQAVLMLDLSETNVEGILRAMLSNLLDKDESPSATEQALKAMFTHDGVHQLGKTIQGSCTTYGGYGGYDIDQSWLCILCTLPNVSKRYVAIARLRHPANLGRTSQEVYFIILVVAPTKEKGTKNALETGRTFATLFADLDLRSRLLVTHSEDDFKKMLYEHTKELAEDQSAPHKRKMSVLSDKLALETEEEESRCWFGAGLISDFKRRLKYYPSDFKDGFVGHKTLAKTCSTTLFLYFACILPCIALGVLNDNNTHGEIDVKRVIFAQTIGGLFFATFGGQPMVILLTTAPLALYTKVIYTICTDLDINFAAMFAMTGIWNSIFLIIYSLASASRMMKWCTRSTEEIFSLFISIAFTVDTFKDVYHNFEENYHNEECAAEKHTAVISNTTTAASILTTVAETVTDTLNASDHDYSDDVVECLRENSILFLLLVLGTVWVGLSLFNFTKTPFLNAGKRELLADYALPVAVLFMTFFGSWVFRDIKLRPFSYDDGVVFRLAPLHLLSWSSVLGSMGLGFSLSLLFFMDQNISGAMVNSPDNRMKKGPAYHYDLLVVSVLNLFLTLFGLPMMHGALPHSPLHVRAMAEMEERVDSGHVQQRIVYVRETRVTGIVSHVLIGLSIFLLPYPLAYIPRPVLDGLFLYLAITALNHNQMFERIMLLFTEQAAYPPNHYIRHVPQRKVHLFTLLQILQLGVMCAFGFSPIPYMKMVFPVLILILLPVRHKLIPRVIENKYLDAIDGH